jgi:intracellular multiplication protein IcmJ
MKTLRLSYELAWRTKADDAFMKSQAWQEIRIRILKRDNYTCQYCGFRAEKGMQINHIDGNPKNNENNNLEVICRECHMIMHSGLWCKVRKVILLFKRSQYTQNEIIKMTRELRAKGKTDEAIMQFLRLEEAVPWKEDLDYLSRLFGFITSTPYRDTPKPHLTEEEQRKRLQNRPEW